MNGLLYREGYREAVEWYHCNGIEKLQNSLVDDKGK